MIEIGFTIKYCVASFALWSLAFVFRRRKLASSTVAGMVLPICPPHDAHAYCPDTMLLSPEADANSVRNPHCRWLLSRVTSNGLEVNVPYPHPTRAGTYEWM